MSDHKIKKFQVIPFKLYDGSARGFNIWISHSRLIRSLAFGVGFGLKHPGVLQFHGWIAPHDSEEEFTVWVVTMFRTGRERKHIHTCKLPLSGNKGYAYDF